MKKLKLVIFTILLFIVLCPLNANAEETLNLYLFHQNGCPHCEKEIKFLDRIKDEYPNLNIVKYEISGNRMNYNFFNKVIEKTGVRYTGGVPFTMIGTDYFEGYMDSTGKSIRESIDKFIEIGTVDVVSMVKNDEDLSGIEYNVDEKRKEEEGNTEIPILGEVNAKTVSLPLLAIVMGVVDGFNPCAMWVLLFLISMLFNMKDKKRMWILGIVFLITSAFVYLLFMAAWIGALKSFSSKIIIRTLIALVALGGGLINLRSYYRSKKNGDGCEVVDDKKRKKIFTRIKNITTENKFILAVIGIVLLAVSVNLIELACSAGLPLIFTQVLALNELSNTQQLIYMLIYILFFLIDDIVIFVIAMVTLNLKGISNKYGKYSHLIGGIIMAIIGILMLIKPEWLMFNFG